MPKIDEEEFRAIIDKASVLMLKMQRKIIQRHVINKLVGLKADSAIVTMGACDCMLNTYLNMIMDFYKNVGFLYKNGESINAKQIISFNDYIDTTEDNFLRGIKALKNIHHQEFANQMN